MSRWLAIALVLALNLVFEEASAGELTASDLFRAPEVGSVLVSPDGRFLAATRYRERGREVDRYVVIGAWGETGMARVPETSDVLWIEWIDQQHLLMWTLDFRQKVIRVDYTDELRAQVREIERRGFIIDTLPNLYGQVLWQSGEHKVHRIRLDALWKGHLGGVLGAVTEVDLRVLLVIADRGGVPRAVIGFPEDSDSLHLRYRAGEDLPWTTVWTVDSIYDLDADHPMPLGLTVDESALIVASNEGLDAQALFEFHPETNEFGERIFSLPGIDVHHLIYDYTREHLLAAVYMEGGLARYHYFSEDLANRHRMIEDALPGAGAYLVSASRDQKSLVVLAAGPREPGVYYFADVESLELHEIADSLPDLPRERLHGDEHFLVTVEDDIELDAFVFRPEGVERPPLLVLPHGGPIDVSDSRYFDPVAQYFVDGGIAVLKVNYRGSSGRGTRLRELGRGAWGKGIEDDIDAAVSHAIEAGWVDPERMCIGGFSYGGYSALISIVRRPDRYRCAVSFAGVTDIPLQFQGADFSRTEAGRKGFAKIVGDPIEDYDAMIDVSPAYRADAMHARILLGHGTEDSRVEAEHTYRMAAMLDAHGKPYDSYLIEGAGHTPGFEAFSKFMTRMREFVVESVQDRASEARSGSEAN